MKNSVFALGLSVAARRMPPAPPLKKSATRTPSAAIDLSRQRADRERRVAGRLHAGPLGAAAAERPLRRAERAAGTDQLDEDGLATLQLPAESTKSLICFALTPNVNYEFNNLTGVPQPNARFTARAVITIENEVLDDPALIDPNTGLPYGGQMTLPLRTYSESRSIAVGEREQKSMFLSRHCIGGLVSKRSLVGSGLTEIQAKQFFKKPMKFTFGSSGTVQMVDFSNYFYGIRLYGDSKDKK